MATGITGITVAQPARRCELYDEFFSLVYADADLLREEFDALIADAWGDRQRSGADRSAERLAALPSYNGPRLRASTQVPQLADPRIDRLSRQRSPP